MLFLVYHFCFSFGFLYTRISHIDPLDIMTAQFQITIGVLALQGAFNEHIQCLRLAAEHLQSQSPDQKRAYNFKEVRTESELNSCDGLIIPGGESTAISLVAQRCGMLEPLRNFVKCVILFHSLTHQGVYVQMRIDVLTESTELKEDQHGEHAPA